MTTARDIMTTDATCIGANESLLTAAQRMAQLDVGSLPICGEDSRLKGMLTDRDIVVKGLAQGKDPADCTAGEFAQGEAITIGADDDAHAILETMTRHQVRRLPVIDGHDLVGMVGLADVVRALPDEKVATILEAITDGGASGESTINLTGGPQQAQSASQQTGLEGSISEQPMQQQSSAQPVVEPAEHIVDLILARHEQIKAQFTAVGTSIGGQKEELFHDLVRMLAVHEAAEEELIHPMVRKYAGDAAVEDRLAEEDEAKHALARIYDMGVDHPQFDVELLALADDVVAHAEAEEAEELPHLRTELSDEEAERLAKLFKAAEATAPTRPHPAAGESAIGNLLAGPPLAVFDRIRDLVRDAGKQS
jgi:CBS domain-containing protein/hemerythrin superfamily protein